MLVVHENAQRRMSEAIAWAARNKLVDQLQDQLIYLDEYANRKGCLYDRTQGSNTRCILYHDHAPWSFYFVMEHLVDNAWKRYFNGGLIYQGPTQKCDGSFPALTVSLASGDGWHVHT